MQRDRAEAQALPDLPAQSSTSASETAELLVAHIREDGPPFVVVGPDTTVIFCTYAAERLLGSPLLSTKFADRLDPIAVSDLHAAASTEIAWSHSIRHPTDAEASVACTLLGRRVHGSTAESSFIIGFSDSSESSNRIAELEASQQRSLALLEAMPDLLFRVSRDLTFLDYRDPTTRGLGVSPEDFLGKRLDEFLPPEIVALVEPNLLQALTTDETVTYASHYDYEDGRHTFENRVVKSGDDEVVLICRDTTEQTRTAEELQRNQARFQRIVEHSREYTAITNQQGLITFISAPVERILGYHPDELIGTSFKDLVHPDDFTTVDIALVRLRAAVGDRPLRLRLRVKGGGWRIIESTTKVLFDDELIGGMLTHCRDITDYVEVQENLRESLARLDAIVDTAAEGILTLDDSGSVTSLNRAARRMYRLDDAIGQSFEVTGLFTESSSALILDAMRRAGVSQLRSLESLAAELECIRSDGSTFPASVSMSSIERDGGLTFAAIVRDDSERRALERQLEYQATHDVLTGLPNRNLFMGRLERALRRSSVGGDKVAVLFLDLDRFKIVNDSLGHAAGDRLLCAVAERLTAAMRSDATVARFGGDEFIVLCPALKDVAEVRAIARRVLEALHESISTGGESAEEIFVSASAGIAVYGAEMGLIEPELMVRNADVALYQAKESGRDRFEIFDWLDTSRNHNRLSIETSLRHALARNELLVHYQPIQAIGSLRYSGTEALVRWNHDGNLIPPVRFIPIAEESDLIVDIGRWVLHQSCVQTAAWRKLPGMQDLSIAVNVSGRQLDRGDFPETLRGVLNETGLDPLALTLEITETRLVHDDDAMLGLLAEIKATGARIAIDDFGTGYSSLGYLRRLPVDVIKLDRCFTSQLENDRHTREIVRTITTLAHTLGMTVVAEGVETEGQLLVLEQLSCDFAQGFYLARPAADEVVTKLFTSLPSDTAWR